MAIKNPVKPRNHSMLNSVLTNFNGIFVKNVKIIVVDQKVFRILVKKQIWVFCCDFMFGA
jgi:hypothetical protein